MEWPQFRAADVLRGRPAGLRAGRDPAGPRRLRFRLGRLRRHQRRDFDHGSGIGIFSTQTLAAFFLGFGWSGVVAIRAGLSTLPAIFVAFGVGVVSMAAMFVMLRSLLSLQAKGNLDYDSAIGNEGTVYVTIPGSDQDGGQIQVTFQGRLTTASARKVSPGEMKPGERVRITGTYGKTSFLVEPLQSGTPDSNKH